MTPGLARKMHIRRVDETGDEYEARIGRLVTPCESPRKFSERRAAERVPNRLYGATITPEGDAI